jgi:hypothetical protein
MLGSAIKIYSQNRFKPSMCTIETRVDKVLLLQSIEIIWETWGRYDVNSIVYCVS